MKVILASSSIFRKQLLSKLRVPFKCISPEIDESRQKDESVTNYVKRLSINKASKVAESHPGCVVIGSDEVADLNNKSLFNRRRTDPFAVFIQHLEPAEVGLPENCEPP